MGGFEDGDHGKGEAGVGWCGGGQAVGLDFVGEGGEEEHEGAIFENADAVGAVGGDYNQSIELVKCIKMILYCSARIRCSFQ